MDKSSYPDDRVESPPRKGPPKEEFHSEKVEREEFEIK